MFKVDENLPEEIAEVLARAGFDAATVRGQRLSGGGDVDLADVCSREGRTIVTQDAGLARMLTLHRREHPGLVLLRPHRANRAALIRLMDRCVEQLPRRSLHGEVWVIREGSLRIRGKSPP